MELDQIPENELELSKHILSCFKNYLNLQSYSNFTDSLYDNIDQINFDNSENLFSLEILKDKKVLQSIC